MRARNHLWSLVILSCCALLLGCGRSQTEASRDKTDLSKAEKKKLELKIERLVAESKHDTSTDSSKVRSVCTYCGGWKESYPSNIVISLMEGAQAGSSEAKQVNEAKKSEAPFFVRHLEQCGKKGGMIKALYPDEPEWSKLDPKKREE
jgi:hypothetical protein